MLYWKIISLFLHSSQRNEAWRSWFDSWGSPFKISSHYLINNFMFLSSFQINIVKKPSPPPPPPLPLLNTSEVIDHRLSTLLFLWLAQPDNKWETEFSICERCFHCYVKKRDTTPLQEGRLGKFSPRQYWNNSEGDIWQPKLARRCIRRYWKSAFAVKFRP